MTEARRPELLAPAGSPEALCAAVQSGADAVYLGCGAFNARKGAKNFSPEEFAEAVHYCHLRGVKVYLTLNTLVTDRELPAALETARMASQLGVDAVLIQDLGLLSLLRQALPDQPLHASTQMSVFSSGGAAEAAALGCDRVVVARELSRQEIAAICAACPVEVEAFVHGALCMCYSGQCFMSALLGGRSGNRGTCAQPCRLPYGVNRPAKGAYPLSLKDSCLADELAGLTQMGVACLKLEGRMKRPEYVAVVTGIYSKLLQERRGPTLQELSALEAAFSRSGFTDGYWQGEKGPKMFGTRSENTPEPKELFAAARAVYEKDATRLVPVELVCRIQEGRPSTLTVSDCDGHVRTVEGPVPETARSRALSNGDVASRLAKTGGTAFIISHMDVQVGPGLSLSASAINTMRRDVLAALDCARTAVPDRRSLPADRSVQNIGAAETPALTCSLFQPNQLTDSLLGLRPARIYLPLERMDQFAWQTSAKEFSYWAVLPRVWRDSDEPVLKQWLSEARKAGLSGIVVGNLGHLPLVRDTGLPLAGDFGLNLFNSPALDWAAHMDLSSATVSFELRKEQIRDLRKPLATEAIVYGYLPLQITENCPVGNAGSCQGGLLLCEQDNYLQDRTGAQFPLIPAFGCRCELQNSRPLYLADRDDWRRLGLRYARLRFTTEAPEECVRIFRAYLDGTKEKPKLFTRGLFDKGVG